MRGTDDIKEIIHREIQSIPDLSHHMMTPVCPEDTEHVRYKIRDIRRGIVLSGLLRRYQTGSSFMRLMLPKEKGLCRRSC